MRMLITAALLIASLSSCGGSGGNRFDGPDYSDIDDSQCSEEDGRIAALEEQLEEARTQLASLEGRRDQLQAASDDLRDNVDRLSSENWRDVVPDIDSSSEDVESESSQMSGEIDDASETLDER